MTDEELRADLWALGQHLRGAADRLRAAAELCEKLGAPVELEGDDEEGELAELEEDTQS